MLGTNFGLIPDHIQEAKDISWSNGSAWFICLKDHELYVGHWAKHTYSINMEPKPHFHGVLSVFCHDVLKGQFRSKITTPQATDLSFCLENIKAALYRP